MVADGALCPCAGVRGYADQTQPIPDLAEGGADTGENEDENKT